MVLAALALLLAASLTPPSYGSAVEVQFTADTFQVLYAPFGLCEAHAKEPVRLRIPPFVSNGAPVQGIALAAAGQYVAAVSSLEAAYNHHPRPTTALMIGNLYHHLGDSTAALHWWRRGRTADMFLTRAHFCHIADATSEDRAYLEAAARILPPTYENWKSYKPLRRLAQIRFIQGRYDEAIALYQEIIEVCETLGKKQLADRWRKTAGKPRE